MHIFGGIEAGGTKFVCAVGTAPYDLRAERRIKTTTPEETLAGVLDFFQEQHRLHPLSAIGIASFGPVDLHPDSPTHGFITNTPKKGWAGTDLVGPIRRTLRLPVGFDTDVNGAALGEHVFGAAQGPDTFLYLTIGTGIGGGGMVDGRPLHGLLHPETGHMRIPHDRALDPFVGQCPFHGDCWEGLASGPALEKRWGQPGETLPENHPAWALEAHYLALGLVNLICALSPQRIILGGGVMEQARLFPAIRRRVQELLGGYLLAPELGERINDYIVPPALHGRAGLFGALELARRALDKESIPSQDNA